jgi:cell division protein FtsI (penicillin-binding protein 3)
MAGITTGFQRGGNGQRLDNFKAKEASLVRLDVNTGVGLATVNQPTFNPNYRSRLNPAGVRNRAITDQFEPGSVIKPLTIAAALESGRYREKE